MRHYLLISLALSVASTALAGDIYCNAQGRECGDRPTSTANVMRSSSSGLSRNAASSASAAPGGDLVAAQRAENEQLARARAELQKDVGGKRAVQCKEASELYQRMITATVINKPDKDGKRVAMSDAEADQARLNAKMERDKVCSQAGGG